MASVFAVQAKLEADVANFTKGMQQAETDMTRLSKSAKKESNKAGKVFSVLGKTAAVGITAALAGVTATLGSGISRLVGIEEAEAKLMGLGNSTEAVSAIMDDALSSVKGTAFGMAEAATTAATAVAAGIQPGEELSGYLKTVADTAYIAGTNMEEMGAILNKAQTANKATNDTLGQLAGRGIPIYDMLAEQMGVTADSIFDMASKGDISADMLTNALENKIGGAALKSGDTVTGSFANMQASFQRMGANFAGPLFDQMQGVFSGIIEDMDAFEDRAKVMGEELGVALAPVLDNLGQIVVPLVELLFELVTPIVELVNSLQPLFDQLVPITEAFISLVNEILPPLTEIFGYLAEQVGVLVAMLLPLIMEALAPILSLLTPLADAFMRIADAVLPPLFSIVESVASIFISLINILVPLIEMYLPYLTTLFELLEVPMTIVSEVLSIVAEGFAMLADWISTNMAPLQAEVTAAFDKISEGISWFMDNILGPLIDGFREFFGLAETAVEPKIDYSGMEFPEKTITAGMGGELNRMVAMGNELESTGFELGEDFALSIGEGISSEAGSIASAAEEALSPIEELFAKFNEDIRKQQARITLQGLGLSDALVEEVLGTGEQWEEAYDIIVRGGEQAAQSLQSLFNQTTSGIKEIADATAAAEAELERQQRALEEFNRKAAEYQRDLTELFEEFIPLSTIERQIGRFESQVISMFDNIEDRILQGVDSGLISSAFETQLRALAEGYKKQLNDIAVARDELDNQLEGLRGIEASASSYRDGIDEMLSGTMPLDRVPAIIGRFEESVTSSFDAIAEKVKAGIDIGLITDDIAEQINNSANNVQSQLSNLARQRDDLASDYEAFVTRLEDAKAFRDATRDAQVGFANINNIGRSASRVTQNLGKIVERTAKFRDDLLQLQQMGLSPTAYRQILDAGVEVGAVTAEGLLKGGQGAITEINNLFGELESVSTSLADNATDYMYDGGIDQMQGMIDGIVAQDEILRQEAASVADAFTEGFQGSIDESYINLDNMINSVLEQQAEMEAAAKALAESFEKEFTSTVSNAISSSRPVVESLPEPTPEVVAPPVVSTPLDSVRVQSGDTLSGIARAAGVSLGAILEANPKFISDPRYDGGNRIFTNTKVNIPQAATGGLITGSGTGVSDSIMAMLSNGEYVMSAGAVSQYGVGTMQAMNNGKLCGGNTINITVNAGMGADGQRIGKQVVQAIREYERTSGSVLLRS